MASQERERADSGQRGSLSHPLTQARLPRASRQRAIRQEPECKCSSLISDQSKPHRRCNGIEKVSFDIYEKCVFNG